MSSWIPDVSFWIVMMMPLMIFIWSSWQTKKRYRFYSQHETELRKADPAVQSFRVRYCSEQRFGRFWKGFWKGGTWEAAWGLLTIKDRQIVFTNLSDQGNELHFVFEKDPSTIQFVGRKSSNSLASWIRIRDARNRQRYFTPHMAIVFGYRSACKKLYQRLVAAVA